MGQANGKQGRDLIYQLEGRPPLRVALPLGLQHVLAMFTGNLAPIFILAGVIGLNDPNDPIRLVMIQAAMLASGLTTLVQLYPIKIPGTKYKIGSGLPIVMGTAFAFVPTMQNIGAEAIAAGETSAIALGIVLGGSIAGCVVEFVLGLFFKPLKKFFPPLVIGAVLITIGIQLLGTGMDYFAGGAGAADYGSWQNMLLGFIVFATIICLQRFGKGMLKVSAILIGIIVGYIVAAFMGKVDFGVIESAAWFSLPMPKVMPVFRMDAIISFAAVYIVGALETIGNTSSITVAAFDREATGEETSGAILADATGSLFAALINALPRTAFGQNAGIVAMTKVVNRFCIATGAAVLILAGFIPKIGAVFSAMPASVLGGAVITVFAMILINGVKMLSKAGFSDRNCLVLGITFGLGYGLGHAPEAIKELPVVLQYIFKDPVAAVCIVAIVANLIFPRDKAKAEA